MNTVPITSLLLIDALTQTIASPTASHRWHALHGLYTAESDTAFQRYVQQRIHAEIAEDGVAGFFRATFLANVTGDYAYIIAAGKIVQQIHPFDADRLMAFLTFVWGNIIDGCSDRRQFHSALSQASTHEVVAALGKKLAEQVNLPARQHTAGSIKKIALVTSYIGLADHPPTVLAMEQARLLRAAGMEVHVFSSQELKIQEMKHYFGNPMQLSNTPPDINKLKELIPAGVDVTLSDNRFSVMRRWRDLTDNITTFSPDLILFVGLYSPLVAALYKNYPVLGLCVHSVAPITAADVWLTANREYADKDDMAWSPALPPAWGYYHPFRVQPKTAITAINRQQLNLQESDLVLISVGARLQIEICGEWAERMVALLKQNPQLVWMLVGGDGKLPDALATVPPEQLRLLPHREDLGSILPHCDVYINPPRMGGGFSVAEAMAQGLAVVALANSDGGNKLGEMASPGMDEYFQNLQLLISDKQARQSVGASMQAHFSRTLNLEQSGPSLLAACHLAAERFKLRNTAAI